MQQSKKQQNKTKQNKTKQNFFYLLSVRGAIPEQVRRNHHVRRGTHASHPKINIKYKI
jgi:hypothetical protein